MNLRNLLTMQPVEITPTKKKGLLFLLFVEDNNNTLIKVHLPTLKGFIEDSYNDQSLEFVYTMPAISEDTDNSFYWIRAKGDSHKDSVITFCKNINGFYSALFSFNLYDFAIKLNNIVKADI